MSSCGLGWNLLNPLSDFNCLLGGVTHAFLTSFENAALYVLGTLLSMLLATIGSLSYLWLVSLSYLLALWVTAADLIGPLSAPIFVILLVVLASALILIIDIAKDTPIVDTLV